MTTDSEMPDEIYVTTVGEGCSTMAEFPTKDYGGMTKYIRADLATRTEAPATQAEEAQGSGFTSRGMTGSLQQNQDKAVNGTENGCSDNYNGCPSASKPTPALTERIEGLKRKYRDLMSVWELGWTQGYNAALDAVLELMAGAE